MTSRAPSAEGGSAAKPPRQRPKARDVKERGKGKRPRRPPPIGHRQALPDQLEDPNEYGVRTYGRSKRVRSEDPEGDEALPEAMSARIMQEARRQQEEVEAEGDPLRQAAAATGGRSMGTSIRDSDSDEEYAEGGYGSDGGASAAWDDAEVEVSPEDERAMATFMAPDGTRQAQRSLADIIMEKIRAQQAAAGEAPPSEGTPGQLVPAGLDPKVVAVYHGVGQLLSRFTTGKIPKAFKIIPSLRNWEEVLFLTDVPGWTPHAVFQATRLFVSSLNAKLAQRFVNIVLLPHVRRDIRDNRRLHFALFQSLKKACYKPDAFYKGFLLPLCATGDCSLREAVIVAAVLRRVSLPVLHSSAALLRIADMEYSGTNSFFIQVLLNKKYALPYRVVDALVDHFTRFTNDTRQMPVVWHQSLLAFLQRYKHEIRTEDRPPLKELLRKQYHHQVTPEAHRELNNAHERGAQPPAGGAAGGIIAGPGGAGKGEDPRNLAPVVLMDEGIPNKPGPFQLNPLATRPSKLCCSILSRETRRAQPETHHGEAAAGADRSGGAAAGGAGTDWAGAWRIGTTSGARPGGSSSQHRCADGPVHAAVLPAGRTDRLQRRLHPDGAGQHNFVLRCGLHCRLGQRYGAELPCGQGCGRIHPGSTVSDLHKVQCRQNRGGAAGGSAEKVQHPVPVHEDRWHQFHNPPGAGHLPNRHQCHGDQLRGYLPGVADSHPSEVPQHVPHARPSLELDAGVVHPVAGRARGGAQRRRISRRRRRPGARPGGGPKQQRQPPRQPGRATPGFAIRAHCSDAGYARSRDAGIARHRLGSLGVC